MVTRKKQFMAAAGAAVAVGAAAIGLSVSSASPSGPALPTASTPIKHVVVIFDENISFDHYFGTYPFATNPPNEPQFHAAPGTPNVNGLSNALLTANPNVNEPARLDRTQAITCDQNHAYSPEQASFDSGLMDKFVQDTTGSGCTQATAPDQSNYGPNGIVMDYYDGNTVTALWNLRPALHARATTPTTPSSGRRRPARSTSSAATPTAPWCTAGRRATSPMGR